MQPILDRLTAEFTQDYSQPEAYHFCLESIIMAEIIAADQRNSHPRKLLDLGCGCGVVGIEISHRISSIEHLCAVEIQQEFQPHFEKNRLSLDISVEFLLQDIRQLSQEAQFDLVVFNLPFYDARSHLLSPNYLRNSARFTMNGSVADLVSCALKALKPGGNAYFLGRNLEASIAPICLPTSPQELSLESSPEFSLRSQIDRGSFQIKNRTRIRKSDLYQVEHKVASAVASSVTS